MKNTDLEISQNLKFQKMEWRIERFGWIFMSLFVLSGIAGLFGDGVLSQAFIDGDKLKIKYERFQRYQSDFDLKIITEGKNSVIKINKDFVDILEIKRIIPNPIKEVVDQKYISYYFENTNGSILIHYSPTEWGNFKVNMILNNLESKEFNIFIFP